MFNQIPERRMHLIRWLVTSGWLLLVISLFYDPISVWFTEASNQFSPLRIDPTVCVKVQGVCLEEQPYALGALIFWGAVVPISIFILLVFGHDLWRRICPLSFLSQIPRALGRQRQFKRVNEKTGKTRYELAKVKSESWLGRNYLYLQFGLLYLGLCSRILFINSDRLALATWFIITIVAAITVGYLYGGKSWCNYFCPMGPVQKIYAEPGGLLNSKAHTDDIQITQSMCRTITDEGKEQSACVACQNPCIDIDSERSYWDGITKSQQKMIYYGYIGLIVGYFSYYYLYAGNWDYYMSGDWTHQENQLATLFKPGFYLLGTVIPIPKLIAVPFTLGVSSVGGYYLGRLLEKRYLADLRRNKNPLSKEVLQHRIFTLCTFVAFNIFFIFSGRPLILLMPVSLQFLYQGMIVGLSVLWLYRTWQRSPDRYSRESLASRLRRQLSRLELNLGQFIEGRTLEDLSTDEVYVLAKVLPGFTQAKRHEAYKGVLREALEEGYVNTSSSLEVLRQIREELNISLEEHQLILEELGVEDPELLDPSRQRSLENQARLSGYRKALQSVLALQQRQTAGSVPAVNVRKKSIQDLLQNEPEALRTLRREYFVTLQEEAEILENLVPEAHIRRRSDFLLSQLDNLIHRYHALNQPILSSQQDVLTLLRFVVRQKKRLLITGLLEILEHLENATISDPETEPLSIYIARSLENLAPSVLQQMLEESALHPENPSSWHQRLNPEIISILSKPPGQESPFCALDLSSVVIASHLEALLAESNPLIQAVSFYLLYQTAPDRGREQATWLLALKHKPHALVQEIAETILNPSTKPDAKLKVFPTLEKLVHLFNNDFFGGVHSEILIELANRAVINVYDSGQVIREKGDNCRDLLLLVEGVVQTQKHAHTGELVTECLLPDYLLDELEVLSHGEFGSTIVAQTPQTRILAIPVDTFDDLLERDHNFARHVLSMESRRIQQLIQD